MRRSIKGRMIQALVLWMLVAWALPIGIVYVCATDSQTSVWDDKLQSIGTKVLQILPAEIGSHGAGFDRTLQLPHDVVAQEHELTFQVWSSGGTRLLASTPGAPRAPLRADFKDGAGRAQNRAALNAELNAALARRNSAEWTVKAAQEEAKPVRRTPARRAAAGG